MFVAAYQMSIQGFDRDRAKASIKTFGHGEKTINDVRTFIDSYDAEKRELRPDFRPASGPE